MIQHAFWIAPAGAQDYRPCHFRAEKRLEFTEVPEKLIMQLTCDGNYMLEVNGRYVGRGPARGTRQIAYYDEYDVAPYLCKGENIFSILSVCMVIPVEATQPITPAVRAAIGDLAVTDSGWEMLLCNAEWHKNGPLFTSQSGYAEWRDLRQTHAALPAATVLIPETSLLYRKTILKRDIPMPLETLRLPVDVPAAAFVPPCDLNDPEFAVISTAEPHFPLPAGSEAAIARIISGDDENIQLPLPENRGGVTMVVDFGKEISGFAEIEVTAPGGCTVDIVYEEELYQGDRLRADHTHTNPNYKFAERYILKAGRQKFGGVLMERGFRMIQLTFRDLAEPVILHRVRATDRRYPFAERGRFFCGDYQLNRLWECAKETVSACTTDIFTDCPWRERLFYCNDYYIENRTALKMFGDPRIHKRAMRMIFSSRRKDHLFTSCSPSMADEILDENKTDFHVILSGDLTLALVLKDYYMHTGDRETVRDYYGQLQQMMARFTSWKDDRGIIRPPLKYWNFIDWSFELNGMGFSGKGTSLLNFLYILAGRAMIFLAQETGCQCGIVPAELDLMLKQTIDEFYQADKNIFVNTNEGSAESIALLKALGIPPQDDFAVTETSRLAHAMAALAGADKNMCRALNDESLLTPELYYCIFLLDAMESTGNYADALKLIRRHWGAMLDSGTPTLWENGVHKIGKAGFGGSASLCHGFSSSPAAFLQSVILGIAPEAPGFTEFRFAPVTADVKFAFGSVPTPYGSIRAKWQKDGNCITAELNVPAGCTAHTPAGCFPSGMHTFSWKIN